MLEQCATDQAMLNAMPESPEKERAREKLARDKVPSAHVVTLCDLVTMP
jgi:hypothetical protein